MSIAKFDLSNYTLFILIKLNSNINIKLLKYINKYNLINLKKI